MPRQTKQELLLAIEGLRSDLDLCGQELDVMTDERAKALDGQTSLLQAVQHWQSRAQRAEKHVVNLLEQIERSAKQ
jgi:hypothetical protein